MAPTINWPTTDQGWCDYFHMLDKKFNTERRSPLQHDNRCTNNKER